MKLHTNSISFLGILSKQVPNCVNDYLHVGKVESVSAKTASTVLELKNFLCHSFVHVVGTLAVLTICGHADSYAQCPLSAFQLAISDAALKTEACV